MSEVRYGFIGLGNMGGPMAANLAKAGFDVLAFDAAGTEARLPDGAAPAGSAGDVARAADTVFLSLPNGKVSLAVIREMMATNDRRATDTNRPSGYCFSLSPTPPTRWSAP